MDGTFGMAVLIAAISILLIPRQSPKVQAVMHNDHFAKRWVDSGLVYRTLSRVMQASGK